MKAIINYFRTAPMSKKLAVAITIFTFMFVPACLALICLFPESAVQIVALAGVYISIPLTTYGFYYNKSKAENLKDKDVTASVNAFINSATELVSKTPDQI